MANISHFQALTGSNINRTLSGNFESIGEFVSGNITFTDNKSLSNDISEARRGLVVSVFPRGFSPGTFGSYYSRNRLTGVRESGCWGTFEYEFVIYGPDTIARTSTEPTRGGTARLEGTARLDGHNIYKGNQLIDNNPKTIQIVEGPAGLFQLHNDGQMWKWTGQPCNGSSCPHWVMIDNNPATKKILLVDSLGLFQLHDSGAVWEWNGQPCDGESCPHWTMLDNNPATVDIHTDGSHLLQTHNSDQKWEWLGEACSDWCHSWRPI